MNKKPNQEDSNRRQSPFLGMSTNDLMKTIGSNMDSTKYAKRDGKERVFRDGKMTFKEMKDDKRKDGTKTVAE